MTPVSVADLKHLTLNRLTNERFEDEPMTVSYTDYTEL